MSWNRTIALAATALASQLLLADGAMAQARGGRGYVTVPTGRTLSLPPTNRTITATNRPTTATSKRHQITPEKKTGSPKQPGASVRPAANNPIPKDSMFSPALKPVPLAAISGWYSKGPLKVADQKSFTLRVPGRDLPGNGWKVTAVNKMGKDTYRVTYGNRAGLLEVRKTFEGKAVKLEKGKLAFKDVKLIEGMR